MWRASTRQRKTELAAFDAISKREARRVRHSAAQRVRTAAAAIAQVRDAAGALADSCAARCLR